MSKNGNYESLPPMLIFEPIETDNKEAQRKQLDLLQRIKIGRITGSKAVCHFSNGYFDSKVLSRHHAEVWSETGKVYIQDVGSSNGTFINGVRLSEENKKSGAVELHPGDRIDFGVDILNEQENEVLFKKVCVIVDILTPDAAMDLSEKPTELFNTLKTDSRGNSSKGKSTSESPQNFDSSTQLNSTILKQLKEQVNVSKRLQHDLQSLHSEVNQLHANVKDQHQQQQQSRSPKSYQEPLLIDQLELLSAENQALHKKVEVLSNQVKLLERQKGKLKSTSSSTPSLFTTTYLVAILAFLIYFFYFLDVQARSFWIRRVNKEIEKYVAIVQNFFTQRD